MILRTLKLPIATPFVHWLSGTSFHGFGSLDIVTWLIYQGLDSPARTIASVQGYCCLVVGSWLRSGPGAQVIVKTKNNVICI